MKIDRSKKSNRYCAHCINFEKKEKNPDYINPLSRLMRQNIASPTSVLPPIENSLITGIVVNISNGTQTCHTPNHYPKKKER